MEERCFICGGRVGRGNQPSIGVHERMSKLVRKFRKWNHEFQSPVPTYPIGSILQVSVSQTVEHSSTIISDILSRILNETVMREETICRICFDLLNDIDYHLKVELQSNIHVVIFPQLIQEHNSTLNKSRHLNLVLT